MPYTKNVWDCEDFFIGGWFTSRVCFMINKGQVSNVVVYNKVVHSVGENEIVVRLVGGVVCEEDNIIAQYNLDEFIER